MTHSAPHLPADIKDPVKRRQVLTTAWNNLIERKREIDGKIAFIEMELRRGP